MKRILAILCVIACLCGLCVPAMAAAVDLGGLNSLALVGTGIPGAADWNPGDAAGDFTKVSDGVYVKVISVTAGHAMSFKVAGNDTWDDAYNFGGMEDGVVVALGAKIDLANGGGSKDISLTAAKDGNLKFTVDLNGDVPTLVVEETNDAVTGPSTPSTPSKPSTPAGPSSLALAGIGIPGAADWNPGDPAGDFVKGSDGVYTKVISVTAGHAMTFKIAGNDKWDDAYNFGGAEAGMSVVLGTKMDLTNGAGSQDLSLTVNKDCNLKFTVTLGDAPTLLVEETTEEPGQVPENPGTDAPTPGGPTVTVYAKVPADWTDVRVWAWNDAQQNATSVAWPGDIVMTKGDDGWYSAEVPQGYPNLLINAKGGTAQTADIAGALSDKPIYIDALTNPAQPTVHNEKVDIAEPDPNDKPAAPIRPLKPPTENNDTNVDNNAGDQENASDLTVVLAIVGSVVIIAVAAVLIIVLKKKK
jgi:hypothetical protein